MRDDHETGKLRTKDKLNTQKPVVGEFVPARKMKSGERRRTTVSVKVLIFASGARWYC